MTPENILFISMTLYMVLAIYSFCRFKGIMGKVLIAFYTTITTCCYFYNLQGEYYLQGYKLWPCIYYIVISFIMILPLLASGSFLNKLIIKNIRAMNLVSDVFIIMSLFYIFSILNEVVTSILSGDWLSLYLEKREEDVMLYANIYQRIAMNFKSYFEIPILVYAFYVYAHRIDYKRKLFIIILPAVNALVWAVYMSSRTTIVIIAILYFALFLCYRHNLSQRFKKTVFWGASIFGIASAALLMSITASRFVEVNDESWLARYFGNSFNVGHNLIGYTTEFSYGTYFFEPVLKIFGVNSIPSKCLIDDGHAFHPLIGMRYSDFGFIGTFVFAVILLIVFQSLIKQKTLSIGSVYLIVYYFRDLFVGAMYDSTSALTWGVVLIISVMINIITKKKYVTSKSNSILSSSVPAS